MPAAATTLITPNAIEQLSPRLFAFAYRAVRERQAAQDLVQDAWISALKSASSFEGRSSLCTWLLAILRRRIAERYRRERSTELLEEERCALESASPDERLDAQRAAVIAERAMADLTELERTAIALCDMQELSREEASEHMGITRAHLRVLLHRGRQKLQASLRACGVSP